MNLEMSEALVRNLPYFTVQLAHSASEHAQEHAPGFSQGVLDKITRKEADKMLLERVGARLR